jgi:hypothetical protein
MDPRAGLDNLEERKLILDPIGTRTPTTQVVQPVASRYTDYATPAPKKKGEYKNFACK